jgi:hypothetical protein
MRWERCWQCDGRGANGPYTDSGEPRFIGHCTECRGKGRLRTDGPARIECRPQKLAVRRMCKIRAMSQLYRRIREDTPPPVLGTRAPKFVGKICVADEFEHFLPIGTGVISRVS